MNILIIQENGRNDANRHMRECHSLSYWFSHLGAKTACWGKGHESFNIPFKEFEKDFDVIFCLENYDDGWLPDISKSKKYKIFWSIDPHMELQRHLEFSRKSKIQMHLNAQIPYIKHFEGTADEYIWWPTAVDTRWFIPDETIEKDVDLGFIGSVISDRQPILNFLHETVGLTPFSGIIGKEMIDILNRFKLGFNKTIADDINMRIVETTACKVPIVTNLTPGLDKMYVLDQDLMTYKSHKEMVGVCQWLIKDQKAREQLATNGFNQTLKNHTYLNRCKQIYEQLQKV